MSDVLQFTGCLARDIATTMIGINQIAQRDHFAHAVTNERPALRGKLAQIKLRCLHAILCNDLLLRADYIAYGLSQISEEGSGLSNLLHYGELNACAHLGA